MWNLIVGVVSSCFLVISWSGILIHEFTTVIFTKYTYMWQMKGQFMDGWYVETCTKIRNGCIHHNEFFSGVYFFRFVRCRLLFTHGTNGLVFQWKSTMSSTTSNGVINVKPNCWCSFVMFFLQFLDQEYWYMDSHYSIAIHLSSVEVNAQIEDMRTL